MTPEIKVGFCVAYDWNLLQFSLPIVYEHATSICLSLDKDHMSWAHEQYNMDAEAFQHMIEKIDVDKKIRILRDDFHLPHLSPGENEVQQRKSMSAFMGPGGWHIQIDCDEYFLNFGKFVAYLKGLKLSPLRKVNICCPLVTLIKKSEHGYFYVNPVSKKNLEFIQIASLMPAYEHGRRNGYFNFYTDFKIIHQSWARSENEVLQKLNNWGHKLDFNHKRFMEQWNSLRIGDYQNVRNFHPIKPELWPALQFGPGADILDFINNFNEKDFVRLSSFELLLKNSLLLSKLKNLLYFN